MRQAGTLPNKQDADRFADYLLAQGINSKVERSGDAWALWIRDENQIARSKQELDEFQANPTDPRYQAAHQQASQVRKATVERERQARRNHVDMRNYWGSPWRRRPITMSMIVFSVLMYLNQNASFVSPEDFTFSWPAIQSGELWRLVTPIFLHGDILHLLFNMWWLNDLGGLLEHRFRPVRYVALVLFIAVVSNCAQFAMVGPNFLGMSGVVYGLFGFCWVRGRLQPNSGLYLRPDVVFIMMFWFGLCWVGATGTVANWAHAGGLAAGAALGGISFWIAQQQKIA